MDNSKGIACLDYLVLFVSGLKGWFSPSRIENVEYDTDKSSMAE